MGATATASGLYDQLDERTLEILERRQNVPAVRRRGWLVRRALLVADLVGLVAAFVIVESIYGHSGGIDRVDLLNEALIFLVSLPGWIVVAKIYGLYDRDEERTDHTTAEDMVDVFHLLTVGVWLLYGVTSVTGAASPTASKLFTFWLMGILLVASARVVARTHCRRDVAYLQNTVIVGAGDVGQLIARKLIQHPEYGINLVGFVDAQPKERRHDLRWLTILGDIDDVPIIVDQLDVERVIFAFSNGDHDRLIGLARELDEKGVQVDIVPRLFEIVGPSAQMHTIEGLPVLGLRPTRLPRSSFLLKRFADVVVAAVALALVSPLFAWIAFSIWRDSDGPVFFRQSRLGLNMEPFTVLKFRTMRHGTSSKEHEEHVRRLMTETTTQEKNGLFKLERADVVTPTGSWLRRTSLDELPQLINVLRGDMSLVGPRPCLLYETEHFQAHHFERFSVPAGITGLWQVTARAHSTFREALDMDVSYVRSWSLGLDLRLLCRTPLQMLRPGGTQ